MLILDKVAHLVSELGENSVGKGGARAFSGSSQSQCEIVGFACFFDLLRCNEYANSISIVLYVITADNCTNLLQRYTRSSDTPNGMRYLLVHADSIPC